MIFEGQWKTWVPQLGPSWGPYWGPHYFYDGDTVSIKIDTELTRRPIGNRHTKILDFFASTGHY